MKCAAHRLTWPDLLEGLRAATPGCVVSVETGGGPLARRIADALGLPLVPADVRYPFSRFLDRLGPWWWFAWPFKELAYRLSLPTAASVPLPPALPAVIVDDRVASARTLTTILDHWRAAGIGRDRVVVVTARCSARARHQVDYELVA